LAFLKKTLKWGTPSSFHAIMPIEIMTSPFFNLQEGRQYGSTFFFFFVFEKRDNTQPVLFFFFFSPFLKNFLREKEKFFQNFNLQQ